MFPREKKWHENVGFRLGWGDEDGKTFEKKSPFHKFHVFFADVTWKKGFSRLVPPHGSKLQRAFREIYPGDVCWTIRCREKLFHGIVWALWKGWLWRKKGAFWLGFEPLQILMHDYIYLINWIWYSWETAKTCNDKFVRFKKTRSSFTAGQGVVFLGGEDCSLPCLPWKLQVALVPSGGIENLPPLLGYWWTSGQSSGIFWR